MTKKAFSMRQITLSDNGPLEREEPRFRYSEEKLPFSIKIRNSEQEFSYRSIINISNSGIGFIRDEFIDPTSVLLSKISGQECRLHVVFCIFVPGENHFICGVKLSTKDIELIKHLPKGNLEEEIQLLADRR
jgi:hypothetical protein